MNTKTLQVHGMHCASCASIITKKISKLSGVEHIDVNPGTEKAELYFDSQKISIEQINKTIEPLGYSFSDTENPGVMSMEHDHSGHDMSQESLIAE
jgi:Cu2+-exporting ATPase/Cu+-exporting ATPase